MEEPDASMANHPTARPTAGQRRWISAARFLSSSPDNRARPSDRPLRSDRNLNLHTRFELAAIPTGSVEPLVLERSDGAIVRGGAAPRRATPRRVPIDRDAPQTDSAERDN